MQQVAHRLGIPLVKVSFGEWLVSGARVEKTTLQRILAATEQYDRWVLGIDELDKIHRSDDGWSRALLTELYGVLDRQMAVALDARSTWTQASLAKFQRGAFIIAAGTWNDLWINAAKPSLGFSEASNQPDDMVARIRRARIIPEELLNRLCSKWVLLEPYTRLDFEDVIRHFKLPEGILDPIVAAASGLNFRDVQNALTEHALKELAGQ